MEYKMNILFYLEPAIEMNNPLFRFATLRNSILPQVKSLCAENNVVVLMSDSVADKAVEEGLARSLPTLAVIDCLSWTNGENSLARSLRHQRRQFRDGETDRLGGIVRASLPDGFEPDVVIVWESPAYYLESVFPTASVLYQMPGFFSRPPFASLVSIGRGMMVQDAPAVVGGFDVIQAELAALAALRLKERSFIEAVSPARGLIRSARRQFGRILLLPLQIDGYFMIDSLLAEGQTQFDVILSLMEFIPADCGLLVTNYRSKDTTSSVLNDGNLWTLRSRYPNFLYFKEMDAMPWVSQFLLPEVDGVVTVSSSVGFQAAFWKKPLYSLGASHLTPFNTAASMVELASQALAKTEFERDDKIIGLIQQQHPTVDFLAGPEYSAWLREVHRTKSFLPWTASLVGETLAAGRRESSLLRELNFAQAMQKESSSLHCRELAEQIRRYDTVSFDIFDTLLYRPFRHPADLFDFMADQVAVITGSAAISFREERQQAERAAFMRAVEAGRGEILLDEIYSELASRLKLAPEVADAIKAVEMQMELDLLYPRASGFLAFQEARNLGKQILLISDMYLPHDFIERVLSKTGYEGYHKLYVSSTYGVKKHSGKLFDVVLRDIGIQPSALLHVGDNVAADVQKAKDRGIKPFHLPKANEVFSAIDAFSIPWRRDAERHDLSWSMLLAVIGNAYSNNPYLPHRKGTLFGGDPIKLGYYGFGPLLLGYAKFVVESAIRDGVDRLYFLARDGKIMKEAYDAIKAFYPSAPQSQYLLCSRRSVNVAKLREASDVMDLLSVDFAHRTSLGHLLVHRFGVNQGDIDESILESHGLSWSTALTKDHLPVLRKLFSDVMAVILAAAEEERANYLEYLEASAIYAEGNVAVVDIGYAGTMQESLYKLAEQKKKIGGYYLITFRAAQKRLTQNGLAAKGYLADFVDRHDTYHPFCRHVPLYETLFSSADTSFVRMARHWSGSLRPVHMPQAEQEQTRERVVRQIHEGALELVSTASRTFGKWMVSLDIEPNKTLRVLDRYFENPHPRDARILSGVVFEDAYGGKSMKTILPAPDRLRDECVWLRGREAMIRAETCTEEKKLPSGRRRAARRDPGNLGRVIHWYLLKTLDDRKKRKLLRDPGLFFYDAKNPFTRKVIGGIYLKSIRET
jgi:predicted HAD superfamily hydrolase